LIDVLEIYSPFWIISVAHTCIVRDAHFSWFKNFGCG
jgi:hypothetical protein